MVHLVFGAAVVACGFLAYFDGALSADVTAISLFFSAYAVCMAILLRS